MSTAHQQHDILLESGTNELEILVFTLKEQAYGVNVAKVREVIKLSRVTALPETHPAVLGVFQLRDHVAPLIDLQHALGRTPSDLSAGRIIILEFNDSRIGFLVDEVEQIYRVSWKNVVAIPDLEGVREAPVTSIANIHDRMVLMLDFEKLVFDIGGVDLFKESAQRIKHKVSRQDQRIMLAEDSNVMRTLISNNLVQAGYANLQCCHDGQEAWEQLEASISESGAPGFDLLISDIEMPRMDGLHLTKCIRQHPQLKRLPVVIFSSLVSLDNDKKCKAVGANAQITKPQLDKLVELVDELIAETKSEAQQTQQPTPISV